MLVGESKDGNHGKTRYSEIINELNQLPPSLMIETSSHDGIEAMKTIAPREPNSVTARIPSNLVDKVEEVKSRVPRGKTSVFFSHRFVTEPHAELIATSVRDSLIKNNCHLLEASPEDDVTGPNLVFSEVSAKMWVAKAGIILITDLEKGDPLGKNLPHEFGFLQGQAKPILLLVESTLGIAELLWSNIDGVYAPRFPSNEVAFMENENGSLSDIITKWVKRVNLTQNGNTN